MPRKKRPVKKTATVSFTLYSSTAQQAAPDCLWVARNLPGLLTHLARLSSPRGRQAAANLTALITHLQQAMQAEQAAAGDVRLNTALKNYWHPLPLKVTMAHPLASAIIRLLADLDEVSLKWASRCVASPGIDAWYVHKTSHWPGVFRALAQTVQNHWKPFRKRALQKLPAAQPPGPQTSKDHEDKSHV